MGIESRVEFPAPPAIDWPRLAADLATRGFAPTLRMIDDLPAFPGEEPLAEWRELRLGFDAGMVTLRRAGTGIVCLVWGSADSELVAAQTAVAELLAELGGGRVAGPAG